MTKHELTQKMDEYAQATEKIIRAELSKREMPKRLRDAMEYSIFAGGKRLRPSLVLGTYEMFGNDYAKTGEAVLILAAAIELIHTYSLVHDDLPCMDDDDYRRGKPSNHKVFGEAMAVLAGDALYSFATELMVEGINKAGNSCGYLEAIHGIIQFTGCSGMIAGQVLDITSQNKSSASENDLNELHTNKTGKMIIASVLAGAYAGENEPGSQQLEDLMRFASEFGMLFQITDDLLDVCGDMEYLGKETGHDAEMDKLTYPKMYGVIESKKLAKQTAERAIAAIRNVSANCSMHVALTESTLTRKK